MLLMDDAGWTMLKMRGRWSLLVVGMVLHRKKPISLDEPIRHYVDHPQ